MKIVEEGRPLSFENLDWYLERPGLVEKYPIVLDMEADRNRVEVKDQEVRDAWRASWIRSLSCYERVMDE